MKKNFAFTLSEILIAMSIIGVIAAITVPTLVNNYQKNANVLQLRKVVNELEAAADMYITEEGKQNLSQTDVFTTESEADGIEKFMQKFKIIKKCGSDNTDECFASENYTSINNDEDKEFNCTHNSYLLANSAAVCIQKRIKFGDIISNSSGKLKVVTMYPQSFLLIQIDTNGAEGPNIGGRDMFEVYMNENGEIVPNSKIETGKSYIIACENEDCTKDCGKYSNGRGCYGKLLENNWKMDY